MPRMENNSKSRIHKQDQNKVKVPDIGVSLSKEKDIANKSLNLAFEEIGRLNGELENLQNFIKLQYQNKK